MPGARPSRAASIAGRSLVLAILLAIGIGGAIALRPVSVPIRPTTDMATTPRHAATAERGAAREPRRAAPDAVPAEVPPAAGIDPATPLAVAGHLVRITGLVMRTDGSPVHRASVLLVPAPDRAAEPMLATRTATDGSFGFPAVATPGDGARVLAAHEGLGSTDIRIDPSASLRLHLVLAPTPPAAVRGSVVDARGDPIVDARVGLGPWFTTTDIDGTFDLQVVHDLDPSASLHALAAGHGGVRTDGWRGVVDHGGELRIQLADERSIAGRVVDPTGQPCVDWSVRITDATPLGDGSGLTIEGWSGAPSTRTDAAGAFRLTGLLDRPYVLEAWAHATGDRTGGVAWSEPIVPGDAAVDPRVELRVRPTDQQPVHGVVLGTSGPLAAALVGGERPGAEAGPGLASMRFDDRTTTDSDGRFRWTPRGPTRALWIDAAGHVAVRVPLPVGSTDHGWVIRLAPLRRLRCLDFGVHEETVGVLDGAAGWRTASAEAPAEPADIELSGSGASTLLRIGGHTLGPLGPIAANATLRFCPPPAELPASASVTDKPRAPVVIPTAEPPPPEPKLGTWK